ncbi:MAG: fluoride efflux transporter CrcB [Bacteroidia bacterium]
MKWIFVFIGSGIGGCLRLLVSESINLLPQMRFPLATFLANLLACLLMSVILALWQRQMGIDDKWKLFFTVGVCGGFSTFSTFSNETLQLIAGKEYSLAFLYVMMSLGTCLFVLWLGTSKH